MAKINKKHFTLPSERAWEIENPSKTLFPAQFLKVRNKESRKYNVLPSELAVGQEFMYMDAFFRTPKHARKGTRQSILNTTQIC